MEIPVDKAKKYYKYQFDTMSLHSKFSNSMDGVLEDVLESNDNIERIIDSKILSEKIINILDSYGFSKKDLEILKLKYGFYGFMESNSKIAERYGVTRDAIRQRIEKVLRKLRNEKEILKLACYMDDEVSSLSYANSHRKR